MARETKVVEIDGRKYRMTQFGAKQGRRVLFRLSKFIIPAVSNLKGKSEEDILAEIFSRIDEKDFEAFCDDFASVCYVSVPNDAGIELEKQLDKIFDDHFAGRYGAMLKWVVESGKFNFADFLDQMADLAVDAKSDALAKNLSKSPSP